MKEVDKRKITLDFIKRHKLAVLATADNNCNPEAAVIEFSQKNNFELIFDTFSHFRKYKNIKNNPNVAVVIGWDEDITVQYEGNAVELKGAELLKCVMIHATKLPNVRKFTKIKGVKFFKIIPKWIRYNDLNTTPWNVFEIHF